MKVEALRYGDRKGYTVAAFNRGITRGTEARHGSALRKSELSSPMVSRTCEQSTADPLRGAPHGSIFKPTKNTESLASIGDGIWADYIAALRSGSATRIAIAKAAVAAFNEAL